MGVVTYTQKATVWKQTVDDKGNRSYVNSGTFPAREYSRKNLSRSADGEIIITTTGLYISFPGVAAGDFVAIGDFSSEADPVAVATAIKERIYSNMFPNDVRVEF